MNKVWICCPDCGKKLFRIDKTSSCKNIYIWCKSCKKEILVKEPKSHVIEK
jgi:DNA-directed RNA polymerase subunit RPC12/RpoP